MYTIFIFNQREDIMSDTLNSLDKEINKLEKEITDKKANFTKNNKKLEEAQRNLERLNNLRRKITQTEQLEKEKENLLAKNSDAEDKKKELKVKKKQPRNIHSDGETLDNEIEELEKIKEDYDKRIIAIGQELEEHNRAIVDYRNSNGYAFNNNEIDDKIQEKQAELETISNENIKLQQSIDANQDKLENAKKEYAIEKERQEEQFRKERQARYGLISPSLRGAAKFDDIKPHDWLTHFNVGPVYVKYVDKDALYILSKYEFEEEPWVSGHCFKKDQYEQR